MSNVLIAAIAIILVIALALAGALFMGGQFSEITDDAKAAKLVTEGGQIKNSYDLRRVVTGKSLNLGVGADELNTLKNEGYLKTVPPGFVTDWKIAQTGVAMTKLGEGEDYLDICVAARKRINITNPDTVLSCDDPAITDIDPCCKVVN